MLLEPYKKANCLAMLNTLFPPLQPESLTPTKKLTPELLQLQRDGFFRYINGIESEGKHILNPVIRHGARQDDRTAWPLIAEALDKYLIAAVDILDECAEIVGSGRTPVTHGRKPRSDSSFSSSDRSVASNVSYNGEGSVNKPLPPSPGGKAYKTSGSTLEKIARELRKMRVGQESTDTAQPHKKKPIASLTRSRQHSDSSSRDGRGSP
jgi:hypothetical protein